VETQYPLRRSRHRDLPAALSGTLSHFGLATLLTVLEMERRTGVLHLRGPHRTGRLALRDGQVVSAEIRGELLRGTDAVFELLGWVSGTFHFRVAAVKTADEVSLPTSMLLIEAARRADELAA
jgi:two-component system OmpR family response regulator